MKNKFYIFVLFIALVITFICYRKIDSYVVRHGYVESNNNGIIRIIDTSGTVWEWEEEAGEHFEKWDDVKLIMNNNHTIDTIEDDKIEKIKLDK